MRGFRKQTATALATILTGCLALAAGREAGDESWFEALLEEKAAAARIVGEVLDPVPLPDFGQDDFTVTLWLRTERDGTLFAKSAPEGKWEPDGKALFIRGGRLAFDVGWVGVVGGERVVADGEWHHVAFLGSRPQRIYVDGVLDATGELRRAADVPGHAFKLGLASSDFPSAENRLRGELDELRVYGRELSRGEIAELAEGRLPRSDRGLLGYWPFDDGVDDASGNRNHALPTGPTRFVPGPSGRALSLTGETHLTIACAAGAAPDARLWASLAARFADETASREMTWEREDGIWGADWKTVSFAEIATRYAGATREPAAVAEEIRRLAASVSTAAELKRVRALYLTSRQHGELMSEIAGLRLDDLRTGIGALYQGEAPGSELLARLDTLEREVSRWASGPPASEDLEHWRKQVAVLRRDALLKHNPLLDFDELLFVRRYTYNANHYYTEYINSAWMPGGNLCILNLANGSVRELVPELEGGVFGRFDLSFDAKRVVFGWKKAAQEGYRIYEVNIDGTGLRQLTFPQGDEEDLVRLFRVREHYHHGTDDMHPCYLPDGGIAFISTRCQYGILCDSPDDFTTTVLYRMDADGRNLRKLTNSSVSEAAPVVLPDGRILYTRWEYLDKGAVSVKCLWAMRPDGSASSEIYAADVSLPPTFIYARSIPGADNKYVTLGTPHYPQNGLGTVIRLDMTQPIRTRKPMTYMTPYVDIRAEGGFHQRQEDGGWKRTDEAPLFRDPYPLSEEYFLVAHKPAGLHWTDAGGYSLHLLDENGAVQELHADPEMSCWQPYPLKPRRRPAILESSFDRGLAAEGLAACVVTDVYHGLEGVERGSIKYIRVIEQVPRPWAARRRWDGDCVDQQHATVTLNTHLGLKVQHGIVPVEEDGSAHFVVPAEKNISLQILDEDYLAVQTERTYVNYMPGEVRSCVGCHETPDDAADARSASVVAALRRPPSVPGPQPGEESGRRPLYFPEDVQPVLDKHCVKCHGGEEPKADLRLTGEWTAMFSASYESLLERAVFPVIGENHPKTGNVHYLPARSLGSHNSVLATMLAPGRVILADPEDAARATELSEVHAELGLTPEERLRITNWIDTNAQFYGSYWGRKNLRYRNHPNFRPIPTFETATRLTSPIPEGER